MSVEPTDAHLGWHEQAIWFCSEGCKRSSPRTPPALRRQHDRSEHHPDGVPPQSRLHDTAVMAIDGHLADQQHIHAELERVRADLHHLVAYATEADLARRTNGTRWTNGQMLSHMAFGYVLVRRLLPLVRLFRRLPERFSRLFASALNATTTPFHHINHLGGVAGAAANRSRALPNRGSHRLERPPRRSYERTNLKHDRAFTFTNCQLSPRRQTTRDDRACCRRD